MFYANAFRIVVLSSHTRPLRHQQEYGDSVSDIVSGQALSG